MQTTPPEYAALIWKQAWAKAWADTRSVTAGFAILLAAAVVTLAIKQETRNVLTLAGSLGILVVFLVFRLGHASFQEYVALQGKINELKSSLVMVNSELVDKVNHQELADALITQHERGKRLIRAEGTDAVAHDAAVASWVADTLEIMHRHGCSKQEIHLVESVTNLDVAGTPTHFTGKARFVFVRTERIARVLTDHTNIARDLSLAARSKNA